jgi:adenine-specific DNA methylase
MCDFAIRVAVELAYCDVANRPHRSVDASGVRVQGSAREKTRQSSSTTAIFRPIQYLGNKLRAINPILAASAKLAPTGRVIDMFSGSSVVSQAYAAAGYSVTAVDTQKYAATIAATMLGVRRNSDECVPVSEVLARSVEIQGDRLFREWHPSFSAESLFLKGRDSIGLRRLYDQLPLDWDVGQRHDNAFAGPPLVTSIYAGRYFGVGQALEIDAIRRAIEWCYETEVISSWQRDASMTSLFSAMSAAVHSAGKHFAQPLGAGGASSKFLDGRLLVDRAVSISGAFGEAGRSIDVGAAFDRNHTALCGAAETLDLGLLRPQLIYLDPPYTAQQYSRFYHLLETVDNYTYPQLRTGGTVTNGLYPAERYKSAFSSRRAISALRTILSQSATEGIPALLSYSASSARSTGNSRMIALDELVEECVAAYGAAHVDLQALDHSYRQFNSAELSNSERDDTELLISCRTP